MKRHANGEQAMKPQNLSLLIVVLLGTSMAAFGQGQADMRQTGQIMRASVFCSGLQRTVSHAAINEGLSKSESNGMTAQFSQRFLSNLQTNNLEPYLQLATDKNKNPSISEKLWLSTSDLILNSIGFTSRRALLVESTSDLRFVSHVMPGSHIIVLASNAGDLTESRQRLVANTASALGSKIHVLWYGRRGGQSHLNQAKIMASLAFATGGVFVDLSNIDTCRTH